MNNKDLRLIGGRKFTPSEIKEILDGIFSQVPPEMRKEIENILKPQFRAWMKIKFPEWVGTILDVSMYQNDPAKIEITTTSGFYDVVDLDKDIPSIVVPLETIEIPPPQTEQMDFSTSFKLFQNFHRTE